MALILIPTAVAVLLAGIQLTTSISTSAHYQRVIQVAELAERIGALTHELGRERALTAWAIADEARRTARLKTVTEHYKQVDKIASEVTKLASAIDHNHSSRVRNEADQVLRWTRGLPGLRKKITEDTVPPRAAIVLYSRIVGDLQQLQGELGTEGEQVGLIGTATATGALDRVKEEVSRQQAILLVALVGGGGAMDHDDLSDFLGSWNRQQSELAVFEREATAADQAFYRATVRGLQVNEADALRQRALAQFREFQRVDDLVLNRTLNWDIRHWYNTTNATIDRLRQVEERMGASMVTQTHGFQEEARGDAVFNGVLILLLLLLVIGVTFAVAGSLVRPLRRLRIEALNIAGTRLPETVRVLRESPDNVDTPQVGSIAITSVDEIGEVARAFDEVHREAVRMAAEESRLRNNINAMFVNLSRRSQTLVERQLSLIEGLEQGEPDENRLGDLFKLDHLATRMRRNSENLLVLAGQEPARRWSQPIQLVDVARASLSEVESYERVALQVQSGVAVAGQAVSDVVHLLAELVENATSFSPRETKVTVASNRIEGGGVMVSVSDLGIGMTQDELAQANWRLANPPTVDVSVSRRMGLFVVGRLALRHGIRVQLRQQDVGGLTAMVLLPDTLIALPAGAKQPGGSSQTGGFPSFGTSPNPFEIPNPFEMPNPFDSPFDMSSTSGTFDLASASGTHNVASPSDALDAPVLASPTAFDTPPATKSDPLTASDPFGTDLFGKSDPFAKSDPFGTDSFGKSDPFGTSDFGSSDRAAGSDPFAKSDPFGTSDPFGKSDPFGTADPFAKSDPFDTSSTGERDLFASPGSGASPYGGTPVDTAWPGSLPAPGSTSWPSLGDDREPPAFSGLGGVGETTGGGTLAGGDPHASGAWSVPSSFDAARFDAFGRTDEADHTGPLPRVDSPMDTGENEFLPIFAAVESDWFRKVAPDDLVIGDDPLTDRDSPETTEIPAITDSLPIAESRRSAWASPADSGWQAAQAASTPTMGGMTTSGLPKRVPKANLVPGSAPGGKSDQTAASAVPMPPPSLSPDRVRSRLSSFQQGVRQARGEISGELPLPRQPDHGNNKEGS
ncbi:sensor histidine kinase [Sinosporangium siamense]|uniref:histidine kinase n=1 Tax=Sinosporangium siamense TaxID=1367973 RepID=A0A919V3Y4_9ACTN|nr:nitrate- and nitrite sensing domain-containing protein [Sinosporangium siamense]GII91410.1 hypothetical protein Ssi02_16410 [Sinosporangium siamense]